VSPAAQVDRWMTVPPHARGGSPSPLGLCLSL
jgi:hypothetical protein